MRRHIDRSIARGAWVLLWALWSALVAGCGETPPDRPAEVRVQVVDEAAFAKRLQQHRGKVVLVDFWATWCGPCVELFPHAVALHERFSARGLAVISVSMDEPESEHEVRAFLVRQGAAFENFLSPYGVGSRSFEAFGIEALPWLNLYDRGGRLHGSFGGGGKPIDPEEIDRAVEGLLGQVD